MKTFKQQVKEIKMWTLLAKVGVVVMIISYVPIGILTFLDTQLGIQLNVSLGLLSF